VTYAVIEIPKTLNRFVVLPPKDDKNYIIFIDDVIRHNLSSIFNIFDYESVSAHMIKITRDAQLEIDSDLSKSMMEKIRNQCQRPQNRRTCAFRLRPTNWQRHAEVFPQ